jgi:hypothetical protein
MLQLLQKKTGMMVGETGECYRSLYNLFQFAEVDERQPTFNWNEHVATSKPWSQIMGKEELRQPSTTPKVLLKVECSFLVTITS